MSKRRAGLMVCGLLVSTALIAGVGAASASATPGVDGGELVQGMSLPQKVGQLFVVAVAGDRVDTTDPTAVALNQRDYGLDNAEQIIDAYQPGGIIYFGSSQNNLQKPAQIARFSNGIQRVADRQPHGIPMFISTDQEPGGYVVRAPGTALPSNMGFAASRNARSDVVQGAGIIGGELRAMGINQNHAPVVDVNSNPNNPVIHIRSFGDDPAVVSRLAAAHITQYQDGSGVAVTAKHFPGHGDTSVDSHTDLPVLDRSKEQIEKSDLPPFRAAIDANVGSIMTAHIVVPALDPSGDPATVSEPILTGILRHQLGYQGVVVTDALNMAGVRQKYTDAEIPVLALKAGADQLLMPPNLKLARDAILAALRDGVLTEKRIDQSVKRILELKKRFGLFGAPPVDETAAPGLVGTVQNRERANAITDRSVTLIKNDTNTLPLTSTGQNILVTGWGHTTTRNFANALEEHGAHTTVHPTGESPDHEAINTAVILADKSDVVMVTTTMLGDPQSAGQQKLLEALTATGKPVIAIATMTPNDVAYATEVPTYLATYGYSADTLAALTRVIYGHINPTGHLPVSIPSATNPDSVLYPRGHALSYPSAQQK